MSSSSSKKEKHHHVSKRRNPHRFALKRCYDTKSPTSHHRSSKYFPASTDTDEAMVPSQPGLPCVKSVLTTTPVVTFAYVEHINEQPNYAHSGKKRGGRTIAFVH